MQFLFIHFKFEKTLAYQHWQSWDIMSPGQQCFSKSYWMRWNSCCEFRLFRPALEKRAAHTLATRNFCVVVESFLQQNVYCKITQNRIAACLNRLNAELIIRKYLQIGIVHSWHTWSVKALRFHVIIFNGAAAEVYLASQILSLNAHSV